MPPRRGPGRSGQPDRKATTVTATVLPQPERPNAVVEAGEEIAAAGREVVNLLRTGARALTHPRTLGWRAVVATVWVLGTVGDAYTTLAMMGTGMFEEANPVALGGMVHIGVGGYVAAASALCVALTVAACGRSTHLYGRVTLAILWSAGAWKLWTAVSNALLWVSVAS